MKIGILGSGVVGRSLATGFREKGYEVRIGTRDPAKPELREWSDAGGQIGTPAQAMEFGEVNILATAWSGAREAIDGAGRANFAGKILIDVTNPLQMGAAGPELVPGLDTSAGETVQSWLPEAKVVKCWNIITAAFMCDGSFQGEPLDMFIAGNDQEAKKQVEQFLQSFSWKAHDLGGIEQSRLLEPFAALWIRQGVVTGNWNHAFKLIRKQGP